MEKRTCKLCFKTFSNGRALGGHMRSHMLKLQTPPPLPTPSPPPPPNVQVSSHVHHLQSTQLIHQLDGNETDSASSSSSASEEEGDEDEDDDDKGLSYGLRENPKKSFRLVDPEFSSFAVDAGSVVQDRESETESSKHPSRRRSKRNRKSGFVHEQNQHHDGVMTIKKNKLNKPIAAESSIEPEPVSSVSDTTPEEDVAWCLMMLSRGIRTRNINEVIEVEDEQEPAAEEEEEDEEDEKSIEESDEELEEIKIRVKRSRGKYQCGTCKKFFRSYQALGGHRASHKKIKGCNINHNNTNNINMNMSMNMNMNINTHTPSSSSQPVRINSEAEYEQQEGNAGSVAAAGIVPRIHECPVCFRVFGSGQALGGHKRSHITGSSSLQPIRIPNSTRFENNLIDLNLPAPMEDEDQIELSAVSDGEFIH